MVVCSFTVRMLTPSGQPLDRPLEEFAGDISSQIQTVVEQVLAEYDLELISGNQTWVEDGSARLTSTFEPVEGLAVQRIDRFTLVNQGTNVRWTIHLSHPS